MIRFNSITFLFTISVALLLVACGTAGPVNYNNEQEPDDHLAIETIEDTVDSEEEAESVAETSSNSSDSIEPVAVAVDQKFDQDTVDFDGDIQVGFTLDGHAYRGDPNAPVVIEEFSDFQCPFCARFSEQTLTSLNDNQIANGDVLLIYYDFPLESIHPQASAAANAARCAGAQGAIAYWDMHDLLYQRVQQWSTAEPNPVFSEFADELNLDIEAFSKCIEGNQYQEQIEADLGIAAQRGVRSTPSFFLNGEALVGAQPIEVFNQAIEAVKRGESIAAEAEEPAEPQSPLEPPRVAPTPATIRADDAAVSLGDPNAAVTIVEYTDYQCPFCQRHVLETMPSILSEMIETGRVQYVLKDLPLDNIHPEARTAAMLARCAGEQDAYWPMHDAIFENQPSWSGQGDAALDVLVALADEMDIDQQALRSCVEDGRYNEVVQQNVDEAQSLGANATPYFFIDGLPIPGAQTYDLFVYAVGLAEAGLLAEAYEPGEPDVTEAHAIGDPNAPVVIIEYTDFQCPFCSRHYEQTFKQIKENFVDKGLVYYIFKDFPLTNIHPQAVKAAEAARCAGDQDAFAQMHGKLFSSQSEWSGNPNANQQFVQYAQEIDLDVASFTSCLESGQYESAVLQDLDEGAQLGVNGTPAFFINGHSMSGAQPYPIFEQAINQFLAEQ
jgi:protein-disulfide isomerase